MKSQLNLFNAFYFQNAFNGFVWAKRETMNTATKLITATLQKEFKGVTEGDIDYKVLYKKRLMEYRKEKQAIVRVEYPTNLSRARNLGYRAKEGIFVVRVRVRRGSGMHQRPNRGRRPKRMGVNKLTRRISIQGIAEQRAARKYFSCEVLNSYKVADDGRNHYFEVIIVDPSSPSIRSDPHFQWLQTGKHTGRAFRGITSAQHKSRGLLHKGWTTHKNRPSLRANNRVGK